ncbi:DNA-processing protein DprA [Kribbella solani]|uniref:DNA processing protein n=1 Tax=Kribbella solani TaxID=236067 RepID=A0A841DKW6_9ACTN|nr:DNA-processing protein DprA [Kribbella solani]MBB5977077.1 DNA processing protein [Kribbella solani]
MTIHQVHQPVTPTTTNNTAAGRGGAGGSGGGGGRVVAGVVGGGDGEVERLARVGLSRVVEPGDLKALQAFDGMPATEVWELLQRKTPGTERWSTRLADADPERDLERAAATGARFVIPGDDEWPEQVEILAEAGQLTRRGGVPYGLWLRGPAHLRRVLEQSVAVVGARASSAYGEHVAAELASGVADNGYTVVSGGAFGIDAAAHRGALAAAGVTVAVLASGVDVLYPRRNSALLSRIAEQGLIVSELPPGSRPTRLRFLSRNRLIAASTLGVVVVEAAVRSGALNSAGWAEQCGRAVLAVPGPVTSRMSEGSHLLVRERGAVLVTNVMEIIEALSPLGTRLTTYPMAPKTPHDDLDYDLRRTLDAVPVQDPAPTDQIAGAAGLDLTTTQECLLTLSDLALVEHCPTGWRLPPTTPTPPT